MNDHREDIDFGFVQVTRKAMPNGEIRERVKYRDGTSVSKTTAALWHPEDGIPWQEPHYHRGLTEAYVLLRGSAHFVWIQNGVALVRELKRSGHTIAFEPEIPHLVLLCPGAQIITTICGEPIGNSDKKGNDWYPADDAFWSLTEKERSDIEFLVRCQYNTTSFSVPSVVSEDET